MRYIIITVFLSLLYVNIQAQSEVIRVKAGGDISKALSEHGKYRFPAFTQGGLFYDYGKTGTAKFNYNYLLEEMQFIDTAGDTLSVANPNQVRLIQFDSTVFYYNDGFMEIMKDYDTVKVAMRQKLKISFETIGAFGQPNTTSAIDNYSKYIDQLNNMPYNLVVNQDAVVKKEITWYLITGDNERPVKADKAGFQKLYPNHESGIKKFLKSNKEGLKDLESIKQLLVICLS